MKSGEARLRARLLRDTARCGRLALDELAVDLVLPRLTKRPRCRHLPASPGRRRPPWSGRSAGRQKGATRTRFIWLQRHMACKRYGRVLLPSLERRAGEPESSRRGVSVSAVTGHAHQRRDWRISPRSTATARSYGLQSGRDGGGNRRSSSPLDSVMRSESSKLPPSTICPVDSAPRWISVVVSAGDPCTGRTLDEVVGVDISPTIIDRARTVTSSFGNCRFVIGDVPALQPCRRNTTTSSFDPCPAAPAVCTRGGTDGDDARRQGRARRRSHRPGTTATPASPEPAIASPRVHALAHPRSLPHLLLGRFGLDPIRTTALSESRVRTAIEEAGAVLVAAEDDDATGLHVPSRRYLATRSDS